MENQVGVESILLKDESQRLGLPSFKILGASWATYRVLSERFPNALREWKNMDDIAENLRSFRVPMLYSATDGNHGRGVARVAKLFGLSARIYMPSGTVEARIKTIQDEGAEVVIVAGTYDDAVAQAAHDAEENAGLLIQDNSWKGYEKIPRYVVEGYSTLMWEIDDELEATNQKQPTHVFVQIGNGSFAEAVVRHYRSMEIQPVIIGVEPDTAACLLESVQVGHPVKLAGPLTSIMAGMNCDSPSLVSFPILQKGIDCFMSIADERSLEAMRLLAKYGIVSGETGAAGLGALLEISSKENQHNRQRLSLNSTSRILLFSTEGATDPAMYQEITKG
jgi:diaminopropionate ammonia-lyase